jgi:hypothetical protein
MELIDEPHLQAPHAGALAIIEPTAIDAVDHDRPRIGALQEPGDVEQGRLAGARGSEKRHGLSGVEGG